MMTLLGNVLAYYRDNHHPRDGLSRAAGGSLCAHVLLLLVAVLYGTLNVTLRAVYRQSQPPTAAALSTLRGWMAVACFTPFLFVTKPTTTEPTAQLLELSPSRSRRSHRGYHATKTAESGFKRVTWNLVPPGSREEDNDDDEASSDEDEDTAHRPDDERTIVASSPPPLFRVALTLALWNFGAQALINTGLLTIGSARAAFWTQSSVVLTPLLSAALDANQHHHQHHAVRRHVWGACVLALVGLTLMSRRHGGEENDAETGVDDVTATPHKHDSHWHLEWGDFLCLGGALSWSMYLVRLSAVGGAYPEVHLQGLKTFVLAILYSTWCLLSFVRSGESPWLGWDNGIGPWLWILYSAAGPGTVADLLQQKAQATVVASVANIVLSMEPIFTAILGRMLLGEETSPMEKLGGLCIVMAAVVATSGGREESTS